MKICSIYNIIIMVIGREVFLIFKHLTKRIFLISIISITSLTLLVAWVSFNWSKKILYQQFVKVSSNYFTGSNNNISQFLNGIAELSKLISANPALVYTLKNDRFVPGTDQILKSTASGLNLDVVGIAIYGKGYSYSSISGMTPLDTLLKNPAIEDFSMSPEKNSLWVSRYKDISLLYNDSIDYRDGVLSYLLKMYDKEKNVVGYALVDIDVKTIFNFFDNQNRIFDGNSIYIIRDKEDVLPSPYNNSSEKISGADLKKVKDTKGYFVSSDGKKLILYDNVADMDIKTAMAIPIKNAFGKSTEYIGIFIIFTAVFFVFSIYIACALDKSITRPLTHIYYKMKSFK